MSSTPRAAFDALASSYDERWTCAPAGRLQRQAVWKRVDPLIEPGDRVLDLGCGTGEDALHCAALEASVLAIDSSSEMVRQARGKSVDAHVMRAQDLHILSGPFDLILSNFGVLNCVSDFSLLREPLARIVRPNGHLALCLMGRFCLWETGYYLLRGKVRKAGRRWSGTTMASLGLPIHYPLVRDVQSALAPHFSLYSDTGIGICVPPSFVSGLPPRFLNFLSWLDRRIETSFTRAVADHRLLVFRRT